MNTIFFTHQTKLEKKNSDCCMFNVKENEYQIIFFSSRTGRFPNSIVEQIFVNEKCEFSLHLPYVSPQLIIKHCNEICDILTMLFKLYTSV